MGRRNRSDHKDFAYGDDRDELSDQFIEGVISNAPHTEMSAQRSRKENKERHDEWASSIYSGKAGYGDEFEDKKKGCSCGTVWVGFFSILLFLLALCMFAVGIVEQHHKQILPLCPGCDKFITGIYVAAGCLLVISFLGMGSAKTRNPCLATPYALLLIIMGLALVCIGFAAVFFGTGVAKLDITPLWQNAVEHDPAMICSIQNDLNCSGYAKGCCYSNYAITNSSGVPTPPTPGSGNNSRAMRTEERAAARKMKLEALALASGLNTTTGYCWQPDTSGVQPAWVSEVCAPSCVHSNANTVVCDAALQSKIKEHLVPIISSVFPIGIVMFFTGIAAFKTACC